MDYTKIRETKIQVNDLSLRLQLLEELHKETLEKISETQKNCNHDLIFINKKYANKAHGYLKSGQCLVCESGIMLTPNNVNLKNNSEVNPEQILDVSIGIEGWGLDCDCVQDKSEIEEAKRVFNSLTNDADYLYSRDCIKNEIVEAVKNIKGNTKIK